MHNTPRTVGHTLDPDILLSYLNVGLSLVLTGLAILMLRYIRHGRIRGPFFWILASAGAFTTHTLGYHLSEIFNIFPYETAILLNDFGHATALLFLTIGMIQLARIWGRPPRRVTITPISAGNPPLVASRALPPRTSTSRGSDPHE